MVKKHHKNISCFHIYTFQCFPMNYVDRTWGACIIVADLWHRPDTHTHTLHTHSFWSSTEACTSEEVWSHPGVHPFWFGISCFSWGRSYHFPTINKRIWDFKNDSGGNSLNSSNVIHYNLHKLNTCIQIKPNEAHLWF